MILAAGATDNYLSLLLSMPNISPNSALLYLILVFMRVVPVVVLAPFLGGKNLPTPVKVMFSLSLTALFLPQVMFTNQTEIVFSTQYTLLAVKELFIGFILAFLVMIPFLVAQNSGTIIDHMRGASALQVTDPSTQSQTGVIGIFYNQVLVVVFFIIGGPFLFFNAISDSFQLFPINQLLNPVFFSLEQPLWTIVISLFNHIMKMAIQLAAPSIVGILMAEMFLGIANRLAPQVQIVFLGIPLKSWLGLLCLTIAWYFIIQQLGKESINWIRVIEKMMYKMSRI